MSSPKSRRWWLEPLGLPPSLPESKERRSVVTVRGHGTGQRLLVRGMSVFMWLAFVPVWVFGALGLALLIHGLAVTHSTADYVAGGTITAILAPIGLLTAVWVLRPIVVTKQQIRIPGAVRVKRIEVSKVAGVGLWYMRRVAGRGGAQGWSLVVIDDSGDVIFVERIIVAAWGTTVNRPFEGDDAARLARTRAGRIAIAIHQWIVEQQGPTGPLALQARQKTAQYSRWPVRQTVAWWSPDGQLGTAVGASVQPGEQHASG